jgi:hypothetical protein
MLAMPGAFSDDMMANDTIENARDTHACAKTGLWFARAAWVESCRCQLLLDGGTLAGMQVDRRCMAKQLDQLHLLPQWNTNSNLQVGAARRRPLSEGGQTA